MSFRLIFVILLLAAVGALGVVAYRVVNPAPGVVVAPAPVAPPEQPLVGYFIAARSIPPGTLVREDDMVARRVLREALPADAVLDNEDGRASLRGGLARRFLDRGNTITPTDILRPRERGFLSAVLGPGSRAVSIGVDPVTGVSGLIWPGDRVDVILTQEIGQGVNEGGKRVIGETVLTNMRVIAIDQDIVQGTLPGSTIAGRLVSTVTLQANRDEAERLAVAMRMGHLSLAIRSLADAPPGDERDPAAMVVTGRDVSPGLSQSDRKAAPRVQVFQGDQRSEVVFQ